MKQWIEDLVKTMDEGNVRGDRTGTGTHSRFGVISRFDLREGFPLVTSKFTSFHSIKHELLWMLAGDTNVAYLKRSSVSIWDEWVKPETAMLKPVSIAGMIKLIADLSDVRVEQIFNNLVTLFKILTGKEPLFVRSVSATFHGPDHIELAVTPPAPTDPISKVHRNNIGALLQFMVGEVDTMKDIFDFPSEVNFPPHLREALIRTGLPTLDEQPNWIKKIYEVCSKADNVFFPGWPVEVVSGDLGPVYGKQLVAWQPGINPVKLQAELDKLDATRQDEIPQIIKELTPKPINQIQYVIDLLKKDPESRRIYLSMWNVGELHDMALMPCHIATQFYSEASEDPNGKRLLSAMTYMRKHCCALVA